ncbi:phosphoglucosamine mutase [Clostridium facile]|uniref:Phosphoglucosamine mutase n=1 Tax=Clostridium facile TaxID=2763035 RepID=A0ABR7IR59_9CLOT|nr:phosphoglucosamine mutase [Clostridium facile]MBC5787611.1 phosphoglucosamine mutase [Clostridium facile]
MGRLFGTDGARGIANTELTCELAMQIGRAAAVVLTRHSQEEKPMILIGRDTRISSKMLEAALVAGLCSVGADVTLIGVIPTPAVAYLVGKYGCDAGIMISASHNPVEFNGIKIFNNQGYKLSDEIENEIEALILDTPDQIPLKQGVELGRVFQRRSAVHDYVSHIASSIDGDLKGLRIAVDCANGSASTTADLLFRSLGADPVIIHAEPNGENINDRCGSTHMESLRVYMMEHNCQAAVAFDGDADRCLAIDENGDDVDGDKMIAIFAKDMKERGCLANDTAVVTVMTNLGFFHFTEKEGIKTVATKVGDRYVLENMRQNGHVLGGEQSGHIIFSDYASTGDGQLSAVQLLSIMKRTGKSLSELASIMERFPQVLLSVQADAVAKDKFNQDEDLKQMIVDKDDALGKDGRILVRPSGTEPIIRVMVEGKDHQEITNIAKEIVSLIESRI